MRRFIKTLFVRRAAQFTVIQDGEARQFELWRWKPAGNGLDRVQVFPYAPGADAFARDAAVAECQRMHAAEKAADDQAKAAAAGCGTC
jgi:hypothetical protein